MQWWVLFLDCFLEGRDQIMLNTLFFIFVCDYRNPGTETIESVLLAAMAKADMITKDYASDLQKLDFQRCARTDKGVSAAGQVVSIPLRESNSAEIIWWIDSIDWLIDSDRLIDWSFDWLRFLIGCLVDWLIWHWLIDWLLFWSVVFSSLFFLILCTISCSLHQ